MKTRLILCIVALFAASCGSDDGVVDAATDSVTEESEAESIAGDAATDNVTEDENAATTEAVDDDHGQTPALAEDEAIADNENDGADRPQRIVSLNPTATEMLFAIGAGDQVVAVDSLSYFPEEAPVTDLSAYTPNIEAIAGFEPDLIVTANLIEGLDVLGIDTFVASAVTNLDDIYTQIEQLGAATGHIGETAALVLQMQTDIDLVLASIPDREVPLTYYHELDNTLYSVTSGTFIGYIYDLLGLENIADPADADGSAFGYPQLNEEFVIIADPDIIFLADTLCCAQTAETVAARPGWDQLSAVQNGNVIELNDDIVSRWGPRVVDFITSAGAAVAELETVPTS